MRTTFINSLCDAAAEDDRIWLLTADLGYNVVEPFIERFPKRFVNVGVAEQNMTGIAAGLAMTGKTVFTYSIANFPIMRCLEQIRNDVAYHNLNVKIVAVGGGLAYGPLGYSHHGFEDLAVMSALPNMTVVAPGDPVETRLAAHALAQTHGPGYLRLGKANEPVVHQSTPEFAIGKAIPVRNGSDCTLVSTGGMLETAMKAASNLAEDGISVAVLSMPTITPFDGDALLTAAKSTGLVITLEEHGAGGLGSMAGKVIAESGVRTRFKAMHLTYEAIKSVGSQETLRGLHGLSVEGICTTVQRMVSENSRELLKAA